MFAQAPPVRLIRPNEPAQDFDGPNYDDVDRFKLLQEVVHKRAQPGDCVLFCGQFLGERLDRLDCSKLSYFGGYGQDASRLVMTAQHDRIGPEANPDKPAGVAITIGNTKVEHCTLESRPDNPREDAALVGPTKEFTGSIVLRNVRLIGQDWTFYHWSEARGGCKLLVIGGEVQFARQGFSQAGNNGFNSNWTIRRTTFHGDANGSVSYGDTSGPDPSDGGVLAGVVFRAGTCLLDDCHFATLTGLAQPYNNKWGCPRIAAVTDHYFSRGNAGTKIQIKNMRVGPITPGSASVVHHLDVRWGTVEEEQHSRWQPEPV